MCNNYLTKLIISSILVTILHAVSVVNAALTELKETCLTNAGTVGICVQSELCCRAVGGDVVPPTNFFSNDTDTRSCSYNGACCILPVINEPDCQACGLKGNGDRTVPSPLTNVPHLFVAAPGTVAQPKKIIERIVAGSDAVRNEWCWQVALVDDQSIFGSGALIAKNWVLTAAHLITGKFLTDFRVLLGLYDLGSSAGGGESSSSSNVFYSAPYGVLVHPDYNPTTNAHDLALINIASAPCGGGGGGGYGSNSGGGISSVCLVCLPTAGVTFEAISTTTSMTTASTLSTTTESSSSTTYLYGAQFLSPLLRPTFSVESVVQSLISKISLASQQQQQQNPTGTGDEAENPYENWPCFVTGWGTNGRGQSIAPVLQEQQQQIITPEQCELWLKQAGVPASNIAAELAPDAFCAQSAAGGTCTRDGGSPLVCYNRARNAYELTGIVSAGVDMCSATNNGPTIYANVGLELNWILTVVQNNLPDEERGESGGQPPSSGAGYQVPACGSNIQSAECTGIFPTPTPTTTPTPISTPTPTTTSTPTTTPTTTPMTLPEFIPFQPILLTLVAQRIRDITGEEPETDEQLAAVEHGMLSQAKDLFKKFSFGMAFQHVSNVRRVQEPQQRTKQLKIRVQSSFFPAVAIDHDITCTMEHVDALDDDFSITYLKDGHDDKHVVFDSDHLKSMQDCTCRGANVELIICDGMQGSIQLDNGDTMHIRSLPGKHAQLLITLQSDTHPVLFDSKLPPPPPPATIISPPEYTDNNARAPPPRHHNVKEPSVKRRFMPNVNINPIFDARQQTLLTARQQTPAARFCFTYVIGADYVLYTSQANSTTRVNTLVTQIVSMASSFLQQPRQGLCMKAQVALLVVSTTLADDVKLYGFQPALTTTAGTDPGMLLDGIYNVTNSASFTAMLAAANSTLPSRYNTFHCISGRDFIGQTVGLAYVINTCANDRFSARAGTSQNFSPQLAQVATVLTHETGHNLNMLHDNSTCTCCSTGLNGGNCVMTPVLQGTLQTASFSMCSKVEFLAGPLTRCTPPRGAASNACTVLDNCNNSTLTPNVTNG